jgi:hypothetical protein
MATVPPSPPPASPREARRLARAAWRAQRAQMRWQRAYYRRPSIAGPLLLLAFGVVALLLETRTLAPGIFWPWYAKWWPLILIALGFVLLGEYVVDRRMEAPGRRSFGFIGLLVLLSLVGISSHKVIAADNPWGEPFSDLFGDTHDWMGMLGDEHTRDITLTRPIAPAGRLTIENAHGDVEVTASDDTGSTLEVNAHQSVHVRNEGDLDRAFNDVKPTLEVNGETASLTVPGRDGASVDLHVSVPAGVAVTLHTEHGCFPQRTQGRRDSVQ